MLKFLNSSLYLPAISILLPLLVQGGQYGETFDSFAEGATNLAPAGQLYFSQGYSNTGIGITATGIIGTGKELRMTADQKQFTRAAFILPDLDPGSPVSAFSAKWNSQVYGNQVNNLMADGLSFNLGPLGTMTRALLISEYNDQEHGFGVGLSVSFDNYVNPNPGYYVRVDGRVVASGYVPKQPTEWGPFNKKRHLFEVDWTEADGVTLRVDGAAIFTNLQVPGFIPAAGDRFGYGGRTGTGYQEVAIDNIAIVTGGILKKIPAGSPYDQSSDPSPLEPASNAFDGDLSTRWSTTSSSDHVGASFPASKVVRVYTVSSSSGLPVRDPRNWSFETSEDGTNWTVSDTQASQYFQTRNETRAFLVKTPESKPMFRLNISPHSGSGGLEIAELEPWELVPALEPLIVTNLLDSGPGSLRDALAAAAVEPGSSSIRFSPSITGGTITLQSQLVINDSSSVLIDASTTDGITLKAASGTGLRLLENVGSGALSLSRVKFTDTVTTGGRGGVLFSGVGSNTRISDCYFVNCGSISDNRNPASKGGAIHNEGTMDILRSTFENNYSDEGGAIHNTGSISLIITTLSGNSAVSGGAIWNQSGTVILNRCTISGNSAELSGAGIMSTGGDLPSSLSLKHSIVAGNALEGLNEDIHLSGHNSSVIRIFANIVGVQILAADATESGPIASVLDPLLAPLGDYGGLTRTMALRLGSPATDLGNPQSWGADQRGYSTHSRYNDLGAYEKGEPSNYEAWIWERLPLSAPETLSAPDADYNGDGLSNYQEWRMTQPVDLTTPFTAFAILRSGNVVDIVFPTLVGRTYVLETSSDLVEWDNLTDVVGAGNYYTSSRIMAKTRKMFYRVKMVY